MSPQRPVLVLIDDEPGILDVVGRFATRVGFDVVPCTGGREGIERLKAIPADLVMVDLRMPEVGGLDVLRADGNVRELRNVVERACLLSDGEFLSERELLLAMPAATRSEPPPSRSPGALSCVDHAVRGGESLARGERDHIQRALARAGGNKKMAAQMLGLSRRALYRRLERLDLAGSISRRRETELAGVAQ